jgi:hypothetical protein
MTPEHQQLLYGFFATLITGGLVAVGRVVKLYFEKSVEKIERTTEQADRYDVLSDLETYARKAHSVVERTYVAPMKAQHAWGPENAILARERAIILTKELLGVNGIERVQKTFAPQNLDEFIANFVEAAK